MIDGLVCMTAAVAIREASAWVSWGGGVNALNLLGLTRQWDSPIEWTSGAPSIPQARNKPAPREIDDRITCRV